MTTFRELYVRNTDGTGRTVSRVRADDPAGVRELEREAFDLLAKPSVESVHIGAPTSRVAMTGGRGRYR